MPKIVDLPHSAARGSVNAVSSEPKTEPVQRTGFFSAVRAEFGRALAAMQRYDALRYGGAHREGIQSTDIPRSIFEEFYDVRTDSEPAKMDLYRNRRRRERRVRRWRHGSAR